MRGSRNGKLSQSQIEEIEDFLVSEDVGVETAYSICQTLKSATDLESAKSILFDEFVKILVPYALPFQISKSSAIQTIIMSGVNGSGKTTTIAKLSKKLIDSGFIVEWAACDTFRAAATEQMQVWADHLGVNIYKSIREKEDPSSVAFRAFTESSAKKTDVLFIDTAGRLHNNGQLMQELTKIVRTLQKIDKNAPKKSMLVLDGTAGQNVFMQVESFKNIIPITDIIITKLDGTAKAGFLFGLCKKFKLNIPAVGIGEGIDDLNFLDPEIFARSLIEMI